MPITQNQTVKNFFIRNEYTNNTSGGGDYVLDNANDTAEDRQSYQGMLFISGITTAADATAGTLYGDLYINYVIHFGGIGASQAASVTPGPLGISESDRKFYVKYQRIKALEEKRLAEMKVIEDKQQDEDVLTARATFVPDTLSVEELSRLSEIRGHEAVRTINVTRDGSLITVRGSQSRSSSAERKAQ